MMRSPDFGFSVPGAVRSPRHTWQAWRLALPDNAGAQQVALWLLSCPYAHPVWSQWVLSLVHLRMLEGVAPAIGRGHSLALFAVDPRWELDPDEGVLPKSLLSPPVVLDFATFGDDDAGALERVEAIIARTMRRELSPDDDQRQVWRGLLQLPAALAASRGL